MNNSNFYVHPKERFYFSVMLTFSLIFWVLVILTFFSSLTEEYRKYIFLFFGYMALILFALFIRKGIVIGYLRGNAVKVTEKQFPNIQQVAEEQAQKLGISNVPTIYIIEYGGFLNALTTRFLGNNFIILFSEVVEAGLTRGNKSLAFILGHELAHVKRRHIVKKMLIMPAYVIPFLGRAYSRACELTCDKVAVSVSSFEGAQHGLLMLAGGKTLFTHIDMNEYLHSARKNSGFWQWFSEKLSTHPHLSKRLSMLFEVR
jgi:Zn-dependent protease with chaperone function